MAVGVYRDPAAERAAASAAARAAQQGRVSVSLPANQRPDYQYSVPTQSQVAASNMARGGSGVAGGGFWEGGDIYINPVTNQARPTNAALQNLREADPWANVNWQGLGQLLTDAGIPLQGTQPGGGGGGGTVTLPGFRTPGEIPTPAPVENPLLAALRKLRAEEDARIAAGETALLASLQATDPMAAYAFNPAGATIPQATLANYVSAIGGSPEQVAATQAYAQQLQNAYLGDVGQYATNVGQSQANYRIAQQNVAKQNAEIARRQLGLAALAAELGINQSEEQRRRAREDAALELALKYGQLRDTGNTAQITMPSLPFTTIDLGNGRTITVPNL